MDIRYWSRRWGLSIQICINNAHIRMLNVELEKRNLRIIQLRNKIIIINARIKENNRIIDLIKSL